MPAASKKPPKALDLFGQALETLVELETVDLGHGAGFLVENGADNSAHRGDRWEGGQDRRERMIAKVAKRADSATTSQGARV